MSHWSADDQDEPPINIVSLEICNAFFDWNIATKHYGKNTNNNNNIDAHKQHTVPTSYERLNVNDYIVGNGCCVQFASQTNAINQHNAPTSQVIKSYDKNKGNTPILTSKAATPNATTSYVMNNINAPTTTYNNAPIPPVIKNYDKKERNIPTLTPNATISKASTSYVINIINTATSNHNINAEVGGVNLLALVQLFQSASTSLTM
eukprot:931380_1